MIPGVERGTTAPRSGDMDQVRFLFTAAGAFCAAALALFAAGAPCGRVFDRRTLADLEAAFRHQREMHDVRLFFFWSSEPVGPGLRVRYCPDDAVFRNAFLRSHQMNEMAVRSVVLCPETFAAVEIVAAARPDVPLPTSRPRAYSRVIRTAEVKARLAPLEILHYGQKAWPIEVPNKRKWRWIVIHHTASPTGDAARVERWHRRGRGWEYGMGYHFLVGNGTGSYDGEVEVLRRWPQQLQGAHVGGRMPDGQEWNDFAIGVSLVGNFEESAPTGEQMESLRLLVRYLMKECDISVDKVFGHREFPGQHTKCPGAEFSMEMFRESLREPGGGGSRAGGP